MRPIGGTAQRNVSQHALTLHRTSDEDHARAKPSLYEDLYVPTRDAARDRRAVLLFNDECSVCRTISGWVKKSDEPSNGGGQLLDERPIGHDPAAIAAVMPGVDIWDAYEKVHVVLPDGTVKEGGDAVGEVLRRLPATRWMTPALDLSVVGVRPFQKLVDAGYFVLDRLRPALGCESCGRPVPWWGKPVEWAVKGYQAVTGGKAQLKPE